MTASAGLVEGMDNLSLIEYDQPQLLPPYPLPSPSLRLALDEGRPLPDLHPSLLLPTMTPLSSPTPLRTPSPTRSMSKGKHSKRHKDRMELYGLTKRGQLLGPLYPKLSTCFEGARLTQLVQLVTAGRLFPCHEGQVDP